MVPKSLWYASIVGLLIGLDFNNPLAMSYVSTLLFTSILGLWCGKSGLKASKGRFLSRSHPVPETIQEENAMLDGPELSSDDGAGNQENDPLSCSKIKGQEIFKIRVTCSKKKANNPLLLNRRWRRSKWKDIFFAERSHRQSGGNFRLSLRGNCGLTDQSKNPIY